MYIQSSSQGNIKRKDGQWTRKEKAQLIILFTLILTILKLRINPIIHINLNPRYCTLVLDISS